MAVSSEEIAFAKELFDGVGDITTRKMMGGLCLYSDGVIFAMIHPELGLMLKCKGAMIEEIEKQGGTQWTYQRDGADKATAMPYWSMPGNAMDDPDEARTLARKALTFL